MSPQNAIHRRDADSKPWYAHRWPWLLMLGPFVVVLAGLYTGWLAITYQDALVVDDYYKQGKAINQDLRRDRTAAMLQMQAQLGYDVVTGTLRGNLAGPSTARSAGLTLRLVHSTQPEKDLLFKVRPDAQGNFSAKLGMLEIARWQVVLENDAREWRLQGAWKWPEQKQLTMTADLAPSEPQGR